MDRETIIRMVESLGAHAAPRSFGAPLAKEQIGVFVCPHETANGIHAFDHGIFLIEDPKGWVIGFSQSGRTRPLIKEELERLLKTWIAAPDDGLFRDYTPE